MKKQPKNAQFSASKKWFLTLLPLDFNTWFLPLLVSVCSTNSLIAQKFYGVELNQNKSIVINQFIAKGFVITETLPAYTTLKGKLVNEKVELVVYQTHTSKLVRKIVIFYDAEPTWDLAKSAYNRKVELLTSKYGPLTDYAENFQSPYYEGDGYELQALSMQKATWMSVWANIENHPNLTLAVELIGSGIPMITYEINSNVAKHKEELHKAQENAY